MVVNCIVAWYLKREDRELWVQRDKVEYTRDVSDGSIDGQIGQGWIWGTHARVNERRYPAQFRERKKIQDELEDGGETPLGILRRAGP